jgi:hypothetical protein
MVVHTSNPRYSGDRGKRMRSSRQAKEKLARPYFKNRIQTKRAKV